MPSASPQFDAIIAGAGISGLSAARHLALHGRRVLVLESRDRTSGRIHTHTLPKSSAKNTAVINPGSHNVDLGARYVDSVLFAYKPAYSRPTFSMSAVR